MKRKIEGKEARNDFFLIWVTALIIIVPSTCTTGCVKNSVGRWDNRAIDIIINNHTRHGNSLVVNISMTNTGESDLPDERIHTSLQGLPIKGEYFNIYDEQDRLYSCSKTNYSHLPQKTIVEFNESLNISLSFATFYFDDDSTNEPYMIEYVYSNQEKKVYFEEPNPEEKIMVGYSLIFILLGVILLIFLIILITNRRRKT